MASRNFNAKQALETEVKDIYAKVAVGDLIAASATADLTTDIVFSSVAAGPARNTNTLTIQVEAAAANPTDTILVGFTGTAAAIVCTVTPNDGTNNGATPVDLTTAELVEMFNTGAVSGKTVTITDGSSFRALQTATGGDATVLVDAGEGDGVVATFAGGGANQPTLTLGHGISSVALTATGGFTVTLSDRYRSIKYAKASIISTVAQDIQFQLNSDSVQSGSFVLMSTAGAVATNPTNGSVVLIKAELKNSALGE